MQFVQDMMATACEIYARALEHDKMPADTKFAVFSKGNPFVPFYERALMEAREAMAAHSVHGYAGMAIVAGRATLYQPKKGTRRK